MEESYEKKKLRYAELLADVQEQGWSERPCQVEVNWRGFIATSTFRLLRKLGDLSRAAEKGSQELWMKTKDPTWTFSGGPWDIVKFPLDDPKENITQLRIIQSLIDVESMPIRGMTTSCPIQHIGLSVISKCCVCLTQLYLYTSLQSFQSN